jgi:hypothetical protein
MPSRREREPERMRRLARVTPPRRPAGLGDHDRRNRASWDADAVSSYRDELERAWSRRWPAESIWRLRRA